MEPKTPVRVDREREREREREQKKLLNALTGTFPTRNFATKKMYDVESVQRERERESLQ